MWSLMRGMLGVDYNRKNNLGLAVNVLGKEVVVFWDGLNNGTLLYMCNSIHKH